MRSYVMAAPLLCVLALVCAAGPVAPAAVAQAAVSPTYDVTTIKPHKPGDNDVNVRGRPASYEATNLSLKNLISSAYGIRDFLIFGLPPWAESARYDIQAKVSEPDPAVMQNLTREQRREMLVKLLKDRFGLVSHNETKVQATYELSVAPEGLKIRETPAPPVVDGEAPKKPGSSWSTSNSTFTVKSALMSALADNLAGQVERFVVDKTELPGSYDFELKWTPADDAGNDNGTKGDAPPNIFTALKEQLGLRLTSGKGPVPTLVVDRIEPPEEN